MNLPRRPAAGPAGPASPSGPASTSDPAIQSNPVGGAGPPLSEVLARVAAIPESTPVPARPAGRIGVSGFCAPPSFGVSSDPVMPAPGPSGPPRNGRPAALAAGAAITGVPGWRAQRPLLPGATGRFSGPGDPGPVDWGLVVRLRREASERISRERVNHRELHGVDLESEDLRMLGESVIRQVVHSHAERLAATGEALWSLDIESHHVQVVSDAIFGYGRLQPLFEIPDAENIEINGCDRVLVQFPDGHREERPPVADSDQELVEAIRFLGESASPPRPFDDAHPTMTVGDSQNPLS